MSTLTPRQQEILNYIEEFIDAEGFPPTRAEIATALGFRSPNAAEEHLRALERKEVIEVLAGVSRGIRLLEESPEEGLPVVGRVAAGSPVLAVEHIQEYIRLDPRVFKPRASYLLRVTGMSMRDAGIVDGDLLVVHRTGEARSGDVVVARLDDEVTVKRLRRRGKMVRLLPENPDFEPVELDLRHDSMVIEGVAVGVLRNRKL